MAKPAVQYEAEANDLVDAVVEAPNQLWRRDLAWRLYETGRRHAIADLIADALGPEHPKKRVGYAVKVSIVSPDEQTKVNRMVSAALVANIPAPTPTRES
jgi:hypothetical protein